MRYFCRLSYNGTDYCGWQHQPGQRTVQDTIEHAFNTFFRQPIQVTGCGRTDTGVHARDYILHFDLDVDVKPEYLKNINAILPKDIVLHEVFPVRPDAHARFDAHSRSYVYYIEGRKNPFTLPYSFQYYHFEKSDQELMQQAAAMLKEFKDFTSFCKTNSGVEKKHCFITESRWVFDAANQKAEFHITANRFLRGMVRLIVGMCLNVGSGKLSVDVVRNCLMRQKPLPIQWSVPAAGLFLEEIQYKDSILLNSDT